MKKFFSFFIVKWAHIAKYMYFFLAGLVCFELAVFSMNLFRMKKGTVEKSFFIVLEKSRFDLFFCFFLVLSFALICYTYFMMGHDSPGKITLYRMNMTEKIHLTSGWLLSAVCIFLLYTIQLLVVLLAYLLFTVEEGNSLEYAFASSGALYTGLYRNEQIFRLYPIANPLRWLGEGGSIIAVFTVLPSILFSYKSSELSIPKKVLLGLCGVSALVLLIWTDIKEYKTFLYIVLMQLLAVHLFRMKKKGIIGR